MFSISFIKNKNLEKISKSENIGDHICIQTKTGLILFIDK